MPVITRYPSSNTPLSGTFTSPTNLYADDGQSCSVSPAKNQTATVEVAGFGFDTHLPEGAVIQQVTIAYEYRLSTISSVAAMGINARTGGTLLPVQEDAMEPILDTVRSYDITAQHPWTRADLLDGTFALRLSATRGNTNTAYTAYIDYGAVTVSYTVPVQIQGSGLAAGGASAALGGALILSGGGTAQGHGLALLVGEVADAIASVPEGSGLALGSSAAVMQGALILPGAGIAAGAAAATLQGTLRVPGAMGAQGTAAGSLAGLVLVPGSMRAEGAATATLWTEARKTVAMEVLGRPCARGTKLGFDVMEL